MSFMFRETRNSSLTDFGVRGGRRGNAARPRTRAHLATSSVWAAVTIRADLISSLPVDVYRKSATLGQVEVPKPRILVNPGGAKVGIAEWLYSSQTDLDEVGNAFGLITERDAAGFPYRIDLLAREQIRVQSINGVVSYFVDGKKLDDPERVLWHERQYTTSGGVLGLSPILYGALAIQTHEAAQDFASEWFGGGSVPSAHLKYEVDKVPPREAEIIKLRFLTAIENGEPFVSGKDWEYNPIDAATAQATFVETMKFSDTEIARFLGVPADLIDAAVSGQSITYANITQRNLQFLITKLGPAIQRRETALGRVLPAPRFVKLNSDAFIRMDPETQSRMLGQQVRDRLRTLTEARGKLNLPPLTDEDYAEFAKAFPQAYKDQPATAARDNSHMIGEMP